MSTRFREGPLRLDRQLSPRSTGVVRCSLVAHCVQDCVVDAGRGRRMWGRSCLQGPGHCELWEVCWRKCSGCAGQGQQQGLRLWAKAGSVGAHEGAGSGRSQESRARSEGDEGPADGDGEAETTRGVGGVREARGTPVPGGQKAWQ